MYKCVYDVKLVFFKHNTDRNHKRENKFPQTKAALVNENTNKILWEIFVTYVLDKGLTYI